MAAAAVGTETDGSIVSPASVNGLVGMKPTLGLISRTGVVPIAHSQDTAGPMARTVTDLAVVLTALAAPDPADPVTLSRARPAAIDYTQALDPQGLRGARIGVVRTRLFGYAPAVDALADAAIAALKAQGAVIVDPVTIETLGAFDDLEFEVLLHEFKSDLRDFFRWWGPTAPARTLGDVIAFNSTRAEELAYFGQELMLQAEGKGPLTAAPYREALARARRLARTEGIDRAMTRYRLDALVAPTGGVAWPIDLATGDSGSAFTPSPSTITSVAGYPHITVPMGLVGRLPVGFSFFGRAWSDARLVTYAYAYEQATRLRRPPAFAPTSD